MIENSIFLILIATCPLFILIAASVFKNIQNKKELVGGQISGPKAMWLSYTVITWFLAPLLFFFIDIHHNLLFILVIHLISFWTRGIVELFMIYKYFNWSPKYGITHSGFHGLMILGLLSFAFPLPNTEATQLTLLFLGTIVVTTMFETLFATLFFRVRSLDTGADTHKIYFASNDIKWNKVNQLTKLALGFGFLGYALIISDVVMTRVF